MNKKERINTIIKDLEAQYPEDTKFKKNLKPIIDKMYDPTVPEEKVNGIIELLKETYERHYETKSHLESAKRNLKETSENFNIIAENYQKIADGMKEINKSLQNILETAPKTLKTLQDNNSNFEKIKKTIQQSNEILKTQNGYKNQTKDPKKLN